MRRFYFFSFFSATLDTPREREREGERERETTSTTKTKPLTSKNKLPSPLFGATMHVITAIIGAGVLSLPAAMVPLGYAGGTLCFIVFGLVTVYTAHLLADCYCIDGRRQRTYTELVDTVFGRKGEIAVAWIQLVNLLLTAWPYQILGAKTMAALAKEACGALGRESCPMDKYFVMALIFGAIQLPFSMVPSLEHLEWASVVG